MDSGLITELLLGAVLGYALFWAQLWRSWTRRGAWSRIDTSVEDLRRRAAWAVVVVPVMFLGGSVFLWRAGNPRSAGLVAAALGHVAGYLHLRLRSGAALAFFLRLRFFR